MTHSASIVRRDDTEVILHSDDAFAPVKLLRLNGISLRDKEVSPHDYNTSQGFYVAKHIGETSRISKAPFI